MASLGEVNAVYQKLEALRKTHSKIVRVAVGQRPVYGHHAQLTINDQEAEHYKAVFPNDPEIDDVHRHHPFFRMTGCKTQKLALLPGEGYKIYQDGDEEVAVICWTGKELPVYTVKLQQIEQYAKLVNKDPNEILNQLLD